MEPMVLVLIFGLESIEKNEKLKLSANRQTFRPTASVRHSTRLQKARVESLLWRWKAQKITT